MIINEQPLFCSYLIWKLKKSISIALISNFLYFDLSLDFFFF